MLLHHLPREGPDELGVACRNGARERPVGAAGREHRFERVGQRGAHRGELGRELLLQRDGPGEHGAGALAAPRFERGREQLVDPGFQAGAGRGRRVETALQQGPVPVDLVVVDGEQQIRLRREVPVERAGRQARLAQHVGDGHVRGAVAVQELAARGDEQLHFVAGPLLGDPNRAFDRSIFHTAGHRGEHTVAH